jgi:hypothetical protein
VKHGGSEARWQKKLGKRYLLLHLGNIGVIDRYATPAVGCGWTGRVVARYGMPLVEPLGLELEKPMPAVEE